MKHNRAILKSIALRIGLTICLMLGGSLAAQTLSFSQATVQTGVSVKALQVADFNGDHKLDIAAVTNLDTVEVLLHVSHGGYAAPVVSPTCGLGLCDQGHRWSSGGPAEEWHAARPRRSGAVLRNQNSSPLWRSAELGAAANSGKNH